MRRDTSRKTLSSYCRGILGSEATLTIEDAIIYIHKEKERLYGNEISGLFNSYPQIAADENLFEILCWYAVSGSARNEVEVNQAELDKEIISIEDLLSRGGAIHIKGYAGERGAAIEALGSVLWELPEKAPLVWELLDKQIDTELLVIVRCSMLRPLTSLFNGDKSKCISFVERLVTPPIVDKENESLTVQYLSPLVTYSGTRLLQYFFHYDSGKSSHLITKLLDSGDETMCFIAAWHIITQSYQHHEFIEIADKLVTLGPVYRRLAADIAVGAILDDGFCDRAQAQLEVFFNDPDKMVRDQASDVFRKVKGGNFERFTGLAKTYLGSKAYEGHSYSFFSALGEATCDVLDLVIESTERLVKYIEISGNNGGHQFMDLHRVQDLIKKEYVSSENNPVARKRILDIIDHTLIHEIYGAEDIVKAHER